LYTCEEKLVQQSKEPRKQKKKKAQYSKRFWAVGLCGDGKAQDTYK
jgi:hypothetical protein